MRVFTGGVGTDCSFEMALSKQVFFDWVAYDPTPAGTTDAGHIAKNAGEELLTSALALLPDDDDDDDAVSPELADGRRAAASAARPHKGVTKTSLSFGAGLSKVRSLYLPGMGDDHDPFCVLAADCTASDRCLLARRGAE